ncbi:hypothetical protein [Thioalkalivibrio sp. HK1]|uniref:hypothetical protein n=1 Tax=Thioalkalivibrio sp. HK1 TaxID=1469245 RepID=UPI00046F667A|nr:hypothetical protein [Thioalkalivibrio sp. HK1]
MSDKKNTMNMETEQARQFIVDIVEQAVTKAFEQLVNPRFDELILRMDELNLKMDQLRIDMRIAISESDPDSLKGTITIPNPIISSKSAIGVGSLPP